MADGLAIWGAITGTIGTLTGLGNLARMVWRDRCDNRCELEVTHGWQFAFNPDNSLRDVWVCVTLYNKGRKPLHVQVRRIRGGGRRRPQARRASRHRTPARERRLD